jgi:hypothetical protein
VKVTGPIARHRAIDLPPVAPVVTEYRLFAGRCRACGQTHEAVLPPGMGRRATGARLLAVIGALTGVYRLSKRQTQDVLADLFGIGLSVGAIGEGEAEIGDALAGIASKRCCKRERHAAMPGRRAPAATSSSCAAPCGRSSSRPAWSRVESRCGAVAVGNAYLVPPLSSGGASVVG